MKKSYPPFPSLLLTKALKYDELVVGEDYVMKCADGQYRIVSVCEKFQDSQTIRYVSVDNLVTEVMSTIDPSLIEIFELPIRNPKPPSSIDRGNFGAKHPDHPGVTFCNLEAAQRWASANGKDLLQAYGVDTRPTVKKVLDQIIASENKLCNTPEQAEVGCAGPWDEYVQCSAVGESKFPDIDVHVEVTFGSNEGIYLSIFHQDKAYNGGKRTPLITGKTCDASWVKWQQCHESAARLGWMLN